MSKNVMTAQQQIHQKIQDFVTDLVGMVEQSQQEIFMERLAPFLGNQLNMTKADLPKKVINATKRNYQRKPCPVEGCKDLAAPRHRQVCVKHGQEFAAMGEDGAKRRELAKAKANAPGGRWYTESKEKSASRQKDSVAA